MRKKVKSTNKIRCKRANRGKYKEDGKMEENQMISAWKSMK
jgi:hypothetical protein